MKRNIFILFLSVLSVCKLSAQVQEKGEVIVYFGGGISSLYNDLSLGKYDMGYGINGGIGYTHFFNKNLGINLGVEVSEYASDINLPQLSGRYMTNDGTDPFEFRYHMTGHEEKQNAVFVNIPLMLYLQTKGDNCRFYTMLGGKFGLPVKVDYESDIPSLATSGYYEQWNAELFDPAFMGFGNFENIHSTSDLKLDIAFMASVEIGLKWRIWDGFYIQTGLFADYGLNDIYQKDKNDNLVVYNSQSPADFRINSVVTSINDQNQPIVNKIFPVSGGLKLRFSFATGDILGREDTRSWTLKYYEK